MANTVKTTFTGDANPLSRSMRAVEADIRRYQRDQEKRERDLTRITEREARQREQAQIRALRNLEREMNRVFREEERLQRKRAAFTLGGVNGALGSIGLGVSGAGALALAQTAIQKTVEQERANRLLAAAATEAGLAQGVLAQKNREFAASVGLSTRAAAETTSQIARLATNAGQTQNLDRLLKGFADLGAARGIAGADLNTLIGTILSGQDEGLNRLGIADPGQLYKAYAREIGKTVEELTQMEKVQAAVNAVLEKSAIFTGAAEARMKSLEGQVATSTAAWENFTDALSKVFTTSGPVTDFLSEAGRLLQSLQIDLEAVNRELAKGRSPQDIAREQYPGPSVGDRITSLVSGGGLFGLFGYSNPAGLLLPESIRNAGDVNAIYQRRFQAYLSQIQNQQTSNQNQSAAAQQQKAANEEKQRREQQRIAIENSIKQETESLSRLLSKRNVTVTELQRGLSAVLNLNGLSDDKRADLVQRFENEIGQIREREQRKREQALEKEKRDREELQRSFEQLTDQAYSRPDNPFIQFLGRANAEMRQMLELAKNLNPALRGAFISQAQQANRGLLTGLRLDSRLDAFTLLEGARDLRRGYSQGDEASIRARALKQLPPNFFTRIGFENALRSQMEAVRYYDTKEQQADLNKRLRLLSSGSPEADRRLVSLAGNYNISELSPGQRTAFASAFEREATRKLEYERDANDFNKKMLALISDSGLKVSLDKGNLLDIAIQDATNSTSAVTATPQTTNVRYGKR